MWNLVVLTVMLALAGGYALIGEQNYAVQFQGVTAATAEGMAIYRGAVMRYYAANPTLPAGSVSLQTLKTTQALRGWSTLEEGRWANYRDANGVIYVYALAPWEPAILTDLTRMAYGSMLVGTYHSATATLYSTGARDTGISLVGLASLSLPEGTPIWMATAL